VALPVINYKQFPDRCSDVADFQHSIIKRNLEEMFKGRRSTLLILPAISGQVLKVVRSTPDCILAGGAALELYTGDINKIKDWDLFFTNYDALQRAYSVFTSIGFEKIDNSDWSITLEKSGVIVQLIIKYFPKDIRYLFDHFDFSVCCFAVCGNDIYYTGQAMMDVKNREFNFISSNNIITSVKRIARYGQKGYTPTTQCVKDLLRSEFDIPEDGPSCS
jgi:hypothetical protein